MPSRHLGRPTDCARGRPSPLRSLFSYDLSMHIVRHERKFTIPSFAQQTITDFMLVMIDK